MAATRMCGRLAYVMALLALSFTASATIQCNGGAGGEVIPLQTTINVPPGAAAGTMLTPWIQGGTNTGMFVCTITAPNSGSYTVRVPIVYEGGGIDTGLRVAGLSTERPYVYATNLPGIGIAFAVEFYWRTSGGTGGTWRRANEQYGPGLPTANRIGHGQHGLAGSGTQTANYAMRLYTALVRTAEPLQPGRLDSGVVVRASTGGVGPGGYVGPVREWTFSLGQVDVVAPSCAVSSPAVSFGPVPTRELNGAGTRARQRDFSVDLTGCPAAAGMDYRVDPVVPALDAAQGVLALAPGGATGVGVQMRRGTGDTLTLGTFYAVPGFSGQAGSYQIPFQSFLYQASEAIVPGNVDAQAIVTLRYR